MSTVSTGLILEVGEPEVLSDTGLVLEQVEIWGTDWIDDPDSPIYEQVIDGGQMVQTGTNLVASEPDGSPNWLRWGYDGSYLINGTEQGLTDLGSANDIDKIFGPSMCGDYKMFRRGYQDSPNLCVYHEGTNTTWHEDHRGTDRFDGCAITGVRTYGLMDWNEGDTTNTGGTYDFWFDDNSGGNALSDNFEQIFEFTCRQFSFLPGNDFGAYRRVCDFATLNKGENNFEAIFQYAQGGNSPGGNYSDWYLNYVPGCNSLLHLGTSGTPNEDGPSGNTGLYSGNVDIWSNMWNAGLGNLTENFEYSDGSGDVNYTEVNARSIAGSEMVTGRTLYLWPREWWLPQNLSNYDDYEWTDEGFPTTGGSYYGPHQTGATMRWSKAPYDNMLTFDILDGFGDRLYVKGTGNMHPMDWVNSLPGIEWPDGVDQTFENFLSFYHCDVSPWLLSDGWRPNTFGPANSSNATPPYNEQGGITYNSNWISGVSQKNHVGSWVAGQYPNTNFKGRTSVYIDKAALGWRAFATSPNNMASGVDAWDWADEGGFGIYVKASNFQNAKIVILTDVNGDNDINLIQSNCIDPGTGLPPDFSAGPPYVLQTLTEDNPETQNQFPVGVDWEQDPNFIQYPYTYNWQPSMVYGPKPYSDHWQLNANEQYGAAQVMSHKIMPNGNANTGEESATFTESFVSKNYIFQGEGTFCQWTWLKVVPINKWQPFSVQIDEVRVVPAQVGAQMIEEPIYTWQNNYSDVLVGYEQMEVDVFEGYGQEVVSEWNITTTKQKWEYLDILKQENPVALTYNSGDLKDIKKRSAGYSKTFELPQNKHNQSVLNSISATNVERPKESIQWRQARIKSNGVVVFRGFARIEESVSGKGGSYKCHIMEDPSWWPNMIGDKKLCDLTLPIHYKVTTTWSTDELNPNTGETEEVDWPTIQDTWGQKDGVYNTGGGDENHPHGAYNPDGDWQDPSVLGTGLGYVYPAISYGKWWDMDSWDGVKSSKDFHPAYYVRYLVEEIFRNINYKVTSNFLTSETFSRLIIPYTSGEEYDNADSMLGENGSFKVIAKTTEKDFWNNVNCYNANQEYGEIDIWNDDEHGVYMPRLYDIEDPSGLFTSTGWGNCGAVGGYRVPFTGRYRLYFRGTVRWADTWGNGKHLKCKWLIKRPSYSNSWRIIHPNLGTNTVSYNSFRYTQQIQSAPNNSMIVTNNDPNFDFNFEYIEGFPNGHTIAWDEEYETTNPYGCYTFNYDNCFSDENAGWAEGNIGIIEEDMCGSSYDDGQCWHAKDMSCLMDLQENDVIQVAYFAYSEESKMYVDVKNQKFMIFPDESSGEAPPSVVSPKYVLGCKTKQIDIIKGITEMFNLHWTADAESRTISCEPYNEFYGTGKILDWSSKLDHTSWTDTFIIDQLAKIVNYKYKTDGSDGPVTRWEDENKPESWLGNLIEEGDLYRKDEEVRGTTVFHSTMSINDRTFYPPSFNGDGERWLPCLWPKSDEDSDWLYRVVDDNSYTQYSFSGADEELYTGDYDNIMDTPRPDTSYNFGIRILNYYGRKPKNFKFLSDGNTTIKEQPYADYYNHYIIDENDGPLEYVNGEYGDPLGIDPFNLSWENIVSPAGKVSPGLYDKYWRNLHEKINGGAALRTCKMNLRDSDVSGFDYRDIIRLQINGVMTYWTVNKIVDYKPGGNELTKVELVEFKRPPRMKSHDENYMKMAIGPPENPSYMPTKAKTVDLDFIESKKKMFGGNISSKKKKSSQRTKSIKAKTVNGKTSFSLNNNTNNVSKGESISLGHGLKSSGTQSVLGSYNQPKSSDMFQIGGGYVTNKGEIKRRNALTIDQYGDITFYGGEVVAEFTTGDVSIIGDVYYIDEKGKTRKLYL